MLFPAFAISITIFALNFIGDGLRDALDPRLKKVALRERLGAVRIKGRKGLKGPKKAHERQTFRGGKSLYDLCHGAGKVQAVRGISFDVDKGESLGL